MVDRRDSSNSWGSDKKVPQGDSQAPLCPGEIVLNSLFPGAGRIDLEGLLAERRDAREESKNPASISTSGPKAQGDVESFGEIARTSATPAFSLKSDEATTRIHLLRQQLQRSATHAVALQDRLERTEREYASRLEQWHKSLQVKERELDVLRDENTALHVQMTELQAQTTGLQTQMAQLQTNFLNALDRGIRDAIGRCTVCLDEYEPARLPTT
ncbi:hypothetical protein V5O48_015143 [Marasmius crinis-equi]|uniref:Uncharacterized protein n=1 Tax=Marasmius crinis-equi TaxID=585013 RepID=A0ABR3EVC5_9AGAR